MGEKKYMESIRDRQGTLVIIFINLVFFIAINTVPNIGDKLFLDPQVSMILERPWTLVTVFFSHEIHIHFLGNMGLLYFFGSELEKITTPKTIFLIYLIAGFIGSLAIIPVAYLIEWNDTVVGASAAVWGIVATFAAMRPNVSILGGKAKHWAVTLFIMNAVLAIINPQNLGVGSGAHAMGIIVGVMIGYCLKNKQTQNSYEDRR
ncbi:rhomboid family intramembrane serine protease [Dethiobacter alkaliphilus]|uniref:Rhomboid family protein n=1 Tax=Dethiobacter alkaliphilus AHT 1 TaxID=555088 RepID=C0GCB0_DETAL|nr:rhomboid family intramembrane serine protease [Dethiobacter alkaliphilus]EEG78845.1 Rhomboid family protein [Dethiobacter alkaliphilus AHT 1]